jgi:hypothetical protein
MTAGSYLSAVRDRNEAIRRQLIDVRQEFALRLDLKPPARDQAVFHCGAWGSGSVTRFVSHLRKTPRFGGAQTLEMLPAGQYLHDVTRTELVNVLPRDWNQRETFPVPGGGEFAASINGLWRHLSALYARACSGRVHALIAHDLVTLHKPGLELWVKGVRTGQTLNELRVWGFVEFPILAGALSQNSGVTAVDIYIEATPGKFRLLESPRKKK